MKHNRKAPKSLQIGFIMDVAEKLLWWEDTSVSIMEEAQKRGHAIYYIEPSDLYFRKGRLMADARHVSASLKKGIRTLAKKTINVAKLDVLFNRKEPPFDLSYLYLTQLMELVEPHVFVINSPRGVRKANEKLYILEFLQWIPPSLVTNNPAQIERFQQKIRADLVLKPLDEKGGSGITLLARRAKHKDRTLNQVTGVGTKWMMAQKFLKRTCTQGDKRILLLNGNPIGAFRRIPKKGEFRSNLSLGGTLARATLTKREKRLIKAVRPKLLRDGLYFVGLDVIDGWLVELNVTSPAGIPELIALEGAHPEVFVVDFLEAEARHRSS
jgi:glutathione synthase